MKRHQARHSFTVALLLLLITPGNSSPLAAEIAPPEEQPAPVEKAEKDKKAGGQRSGAAPQRIHPDVVKRLRPDSPENLMSSADPRPFVMITLRDAAPPDASPKQKREFAAKAQDDLLKKLAPGEFEVKHRFGSEPRAIGYVTASALDKLAHDDQVITVAMSRIQPGIFAALQASPEGEAMVGVMLRRDQLPENREERVAWIGKEQDRVLRRLHPGEFRLASKFKYIASFYGHIKLGGVEKLAIDNDVSQVYLDTMESEESDDSSAIDPPESSTRTAMLYESVAFLNADQVHDLTSAGTSAGDTILISPADRYMLASYAPIEPPSSQDPKKPQTDQKTAKRPGPTKDPIHPDVRSKLEKSNDGRVYVLVTLKPMPREGLTKEQRKAMAEERQDQLLAKLAEGKFTVDHRFETEPRMIGHINAGGLAKLAKQPDAPAVQLSKFEPGVIPALNNSPDGKVFVMILLTTLPTDDRPLADVKAMIQQHQEKVLDRLTQEDFEIAHRLSVTEVLMGYLKSSGIPKVATDPRIRGVVLNKWYKGPQTTPPAYSRVSAATVDVLTNGSFTFMVE